MRVTLGLLIAGLAAFACSVSHAQTPDVIDKLIVRLIELDSIDIAKDVKFRSGLEPVLHAVDADEAQMKVLADPYEVQGRNTPGAAGWYRVTFTAPEKIGKFELPKGGYNLGVETNCLGSWEAYSYVNGKPAGAAMATGVQGFFNQGNMIANSRQHPTAWMSNAPMPTKPGDTVTVAILVTAAPLGRGNAEGFALRHLRLRFALAHTFQRQPFFGAVTPLGAKTVGGSGLHGAREMLATLRGDELTALQERLKEPLARIDAVFQAAETGKLDNLTQAMKAAAGEINAALKRPEAPK